MTAKKLSEAGEQPETSTHRQPNPRQRVRNPAPGGPDGAAPGYKTCGKTCVPDGFSATDTP